MGRGPCCSKEGLNRGAWTAIEDKTLTDYIQIHGEGKWRNLPKKAGLKRCGKSCRLRWLNYLRPDIKRGNITHDEEELIIRLHKLLGNRWSLIAGRLPGRTDNEIKNYWNTKIGKKLRPQNTTTSGNRLSNSNQSQMKPSPAIESSLNHSPQANTDSLVIKTKATRCTKVVISTPEQQICDRIIDDTTLPEEENRFLSDFLIDVDMDDNFLSDFLNTTDFPHLSYFDHNNGGDGDNNTNDHDQGHYSPDSDQALFFSDESLHDSDFASMASLIDSELDWFQN